MVILTVTVLRDTDTDSRKGMVLMMLPSITSLCPVLALLYLPLLRSPRHLFLLLLLLHLPHSNLDLSEYRLLYLLPMVRSQTWVMASDTAMAIFKIYFYLFLPFCVLSALICCFKFGFDC